MMFNRRYILVLAVLLAFGCSEDRKDPVHHVEKDSVGVLSDSPSKYVVSSQRTIRPSLGTGSEIKILNGIISANLTRHNKVSARFGGRIERLYAKYDFQLVDKGSPVMDVYSPELNSAAEDYLLLFRSAGDKILLEGSFKKLTLMGLNESQVRALEKSGKVPKTFTVFSPYSGYIFPVEENPDEQVGPADPGTSGMNSMGSGRSSEETFSSSVIREGAYVNKGQTVFQVNDLQFVWALLTIEPGVEVNKGDSVTIHYGEKRINERIDFVEPYFQQDQKFSRARVILKNQKNYKLNDLLTAELKQGRDSRILSVPVKSVLDLGMRKIVWVKKEKTGQSFLFELREVTTGRVFGDRIEIVDGLVHGDEIAEVAGFMLDSESIIEK